MQSKKILLLVGDYVEDYEAMVALQMFQAAGHVVHAVCPDKTAGQTVITSIHDFEGEQTYSEKRGHHFRLNATFAEIRPEDYDGLVIPGGRAPEYLRLNPRVLAVTRSFFERHKPVAVICHGPQVLMAAGVLKGRTCMAYPPLRADIENAGARWAEPNEALDNAHIDANLVSGAAWPANPAVYGAFLKLLDRPTDR
ncbi:MAG TPA: DJ-1/PfpI family protein [Pirellulales bacterium]|jgi:protease I|nr:DJ-1/PfpI family protein [Pirellulales bacterium]